MLRMAALNEPSSGALNGQRGADYSCYRQARRAGLSGTFRAFLATRVQNLDSIVRAADRELPVANIKGDVLFNSWNEIFDGEGAYFSQAARIYAFNGKNILTDLAWPQKYAWHGAHRTGERAVELSCEAWESGNHEHQGLASSLLGGQVLGQDRLSCGHSLAVLCIEVTSSAHARRRRRQAGDATLTPSQYYQLLRELTADTETASSI